MAANGGHGGRFEHASIVLVDDDPVTTEVVRMFLEGAGFTGCVTFNDPRLALEAIRSAPPDLVLTDMRMPGMTGIDLLRVLQSDPALQSVPAIMLTSSADAETKLHALEHGAADFLAKPVDPSELVLRLRNTLSARYSRASDARSAAAASPAGAAPSERCDGGWTASSDDTPAEHAVSALGVALDAAHSAERDTRLGVATRRWRSASGLHVRDISARLDLQERSIGDAVLLDVADALGGGERLAMWLHAQAVASAAGTDADDTTVSVQVPATALASPMLAEALAGTAARRPVVVPVRDDWLSRVDVHALARHWRGTQVTLALVPTGNDLPLYALRSGAFSSLRIVPPLLDGCPDAATRRAVLTAVLALARGFRLRAEAYGLDSPSENAVASAHGCTTFQAAAAPGISSVA